MELFVLDVPISTYACLMGNRRRNVLGLHLVLVVMRWMLTRVDSSCSFFWGLL